MTTSIAGKLIDRFWWLQRTVLVIDIVLCVAIVSVSTLTIVGNLSLMISPRDGFDGSPLPVMHLVTPAVALVAGLGACYASVLALRGKTLRRGLLMSSLSVISLLYVTEGFFHVVNIGNGGSLGFAAAVSGVAILWWLLNFAFARDFKQEVVE